jgi:hypothetical protein
MTAPTTHAQALPIQFRIGIEKKHEVNRLRPRQAVANPHIVPTREAQVLRVPDQHQPRRRRSVIERLFGLRHSALNCGLAGILGKGMPRTEIRLSPRLDPLC